MVGVLGSGLARADAPPERAADQPVELHDSAEQPTGLTRDPVGPLLQLDGPLRSFAEGVDSDVASEHVDLSLGARTRARAVTSGWTNELFGARGWSAGVHLVHDFRVLQVGVGASVNRVDSIDVHQSYVLLGLTLSRTFHLSRWMTGWISLGVGRRRWLGTALPPGEVDDDAVMLSIGTTFR